MKNKHRYFVYLNDTSVNAVEYLGDFETLQEAKNHLLSQRYAIECFIAYDYYSATYRHPRHDRRSHMEWWLNENGFDCSRHFGFYNDEYESEV